MSIISQTVAIILTILISIPIILIISGSNVTIEKPYYKEYIDCGNQLQLEIEKNTPTCQPPVRDRGYWFFYILGLVVYIFTLIYTFLQVKRFNEREERIRERERELDNKLKKRIKNKGE